LNVTGLANILSGAFGGYTGCISVSRSLLNLTRLTQREFALGQEWGAADLLPAMQCDAQGMQESVSFSANDAYCAVL
jgi:hypothetical protein